MDWRWTKGVTLRLFSFDHEMRVWADENFWQTIMDNLLTNAIRYARKKCEGGGTEGGGQYGSGLQMTEKDFSRRFSIFSKKDAIKEKGGIFRGSGNRAYCRPEASGRTCMAEKPGCRRSGIHLRTSSGGRKGSHGARKGEDERKGGEKRMNQWEFYLPSSDGYPGSIWREWRRTGRSWEPYRSSTG